MPRTLLPYGLLPNGNYGVVFDSTTGDPQASVIEIMSSLPSVASTDNFEGRIIFDTSDHSPYVFTSFPAAQWKPLEGIPATVDNVGGNPPILPTPNDGDLLWDLDTEVLFVWDGSSWQSAGGRYAASIVENSFVGDGSTTAFATGASVPVSAEYVEIHLDGVRQVAGTDYTVVGTTVNFVDAPPSGTGVYVRTLASDAIVQTAQVAGAQYTASSGDTDFETGLASTDPAGVFVYVDGIIKRNTIDYTISQQDTSIVSLNRVGSVSTVATKVVHGLSVGDEVTLVNFVETEYNNLTVIVTNVPTSKTFEFATSSASSSTGTPSGTAYYTPPFINDTIEFTTPMTGGELIDIRSLRSVIVASYSGEENTLGSAGSGVQLNATKAGTTLYVKSLIAGSNVALSDNGTEVTIASATGSGFEDRVGTNSAIFVVTDPTSYVGFNNNAAGVTADLSGIEISGRKITIKDEIGGASTFPISIATGGGTIDGATSPYLITTDYGSVTMVCDGTNWYITAARP